MQARYNELIHAILATTGSSMYIDEKLGVTYLNMDRAQQEESSILSENHRLFLSDKRMSCHMTTSSLQEEEEEEKKSILSDFDRGSFSTVEMKPDSITKLLQKDTERLKNLIDAQPKRQKVFKRKQYGKD